ncbi:MAG: alpha/beta hydrolase [Salinivirgaceae bacterium]|nr:alpha/beta hydrolase [Salinivirgaceae bacterium]
MKKLGLTLAAGLLSIVGFAQMPGGGFGGFGGNQSSTDTMRYSQKFLNINYAGDNEVYHNLDIYLPKEEKESYPVVIHIYGSAWFSNNSKGAADLNTICAALLDAGYAVVTPNHRSSGDAKYPAQINDIKAVIRFVRGNAEKYKFNTSFIATSGFSSGGHLASLAATTRNEKVANVDGYEVDLEGNVGSFTNFSSSVDAACDWSGPVDLQHMDCGEAMKMPTSPEEVVLGVPREGNENRYKALSATAYIDPSDPPIIVCHGKKDNVVPFCQGESFYNALKAKGVKTDFIPVEDGGHGFNMYSKENLAKVVNFLNEARKAKK